MAHCRWCITNNPWPPNVTGTHMMLWHGNVFRITGALWVESINGLPSERAVMRLMFSLFFLSEHAVEWTFELSVIWDTMTLMWRRYNAPEASLTDACASVDVSIECYPWNLEHLGLLKLMNILNALLGVIHEDFGITSPLFYHSCRNHVKTMCVTYIYMRVI